MFLYNKNYIQVFDFQIFKSTNFQIKTMDCLTKFVSPQLKTLHRGKVRDSIRIDDKTRMIVVTDRISAFNIKLKTPIPTKGAVLNGIANFWFEQTKHIIDNHIIQQVDDYITLVKEAEPIRVEMVVRGYLTGSMWRGYQDGQRTFSGTTVPDGMIQNQKFASPILTPTTKDDDDTEIDEAGILEAGLVSAEIYTQMKAKALEIFNFGSQFLLERGIVLVDTKYEFGLLDGKLIIIDEMHTPDSSRFWSAADYAQNPHTAEQIDKEFVRQWMLANKINGEVPRYLAAEVVTETSRRYQEIYSTVTGEEFSLIDLPSKVRIYNNLLKAGVLKQGFVAIIANQYADPKACQKVKEIIESYNVAATIYTLPIHNMEATIKELAEVLNTSIEPVAVVGMDVAEDMLTSKLSVPVTVGISNLEKMALVALKSLNLAAVREQLAATLAEK